MSFLNKNKKPNAKGGYHQYTSYKTEWKKNYANKHYKNIKKWHKTH